jgi:predicted nucleotidyltransferase
MTKSIQKEINSIKNQIVAKYQPQKVILFGSASTDAMNAGSDLDWLVIKETNDHPIVRSQKLYANINKNIPCDFIVYTPKEFEDRKDINDPFIMNIINYGKAVYEQK